MSTQTDAKEQDRTTINDHRARRIVASLSGPTTRCPAAASRSISSGKTYDVKTTLAN